jgi:hypothetical protein
VPVRGGKGGKGSKGSKGSKGKGKGSEGKGSGRGLSQIEVEVVIGEAEQQLLNDRGETSSQQASRFLRELQSDVAEEVNGEGAHDAPREDLTIAQLRRAQFGNPEPRNGTGREFGFKCFGPGCGKSFPSKNILCHHFYIGCALCEPQPAQVAAYKAQGLYQCEKCEVWFSKKVSVHNCDDSGLGRANK